MITLIDAHELNYAEVAHLLHIPLGTVKVAWPAPICR
ncbi:MAG: hypothetical protein JNK32_13140 [Anaerolineales bacterium]|nr:hypothetical protein [Anaerolineales bacterium]